MAIKPNLLSQFDALPDICLVDVNTTLSLFDISRSTLSRLVNDGEFPESVIIGKQRRWRVGDLRKHLAGLTYTKGDYMGPESGEAA